MNSDISVLKEFLDKEMLAELYREQKAKEQSGLERLCRPVKLDWDGKVLEVNLKRKITPETRYRLRRIVANYPKHRIKYAVEKMKGKYSDLGEQELRDAFLKENPGISGAELLDYLQGAYIDEEYEHNLDVFYLEYFRTIISPEGDGREPSETPVTAGGRIADCWNTVDTEEVKDLVSIFRKKLGI